MKLLSILSLTCLILSCHGNGFTDLLSSAASSIGSAFSSAAGVLVDQAKVAGNQLLGQLSTTASSLVSQGLQSLLMGSLNAVSQPSSKRGLHDLLHQFSSLQNEAEHAIVQKLGNMQGAFHEAISKMEQSFSKLHHVPLDQIVAEIQHIEQTHKGLSQLLMTDLSQKLVEIFHKAEPNHQKRNVITDAFTSAVSSVTDFFQPHVDALNQLVHSVGESLSSSAQTFNNALQNSTHTAALQESTDAILQHGHNVLNLLQNALTAIIANTTSNIAPHLVNIVQHGAGALGEGINALSSNP